MPDAGDVFAECCGCARSGGKDGYGRASFRCLMRSGVRSFSSIRQAFSDGAPFDYQARCQHIHPREWKQKKTSFGTEREFYLFFFD